MTVMQTLHCARPACDCIASVITSAFIPSPSAERLHIGPFFFHAYGIAYVFAVVAAIVDHALALGEAGGDPDLVYEVALVGLSRPV